MFLIFKSVEKIVAHIINEELQMESKMDYMKRVMDSCVNQEQLDMVYKWAKNALVRFEYLASDKSENYVGWRHGIVGSLGMLIDFIKAFGEMKKEMKAYYEEKSKKYQFGSVSAETPVSA